MLNLLRRETHLAQGADSGLNIRTTAQQPLRRSQNAAAATTTSSLKKGVDILERRLRLFEGGINTFEGGLKRVPSTDRLFYLLKVAIEPLITTTLPSILNGAYILTLPLRYIGGLRLDLANCIEKLGSVESNRGVQAGNFGSRSTATTATAGRGGSAPAAPTAARSPGHQLPIPPP